MASNSEAGNQRTKGTAQRPSPLQRLLQNAGIPMPFRHVSEEFALFTPEERRELAGGNAEQCEANR